MSDKIKIVAKAIADREQIMHKLSLGAEGLELQLLDELCDDRGIPTLPWKENLDVNMLVNYPFVAVHVPINREMLMIEYMQNPEYAKAMRNICSLANFIGSVRETVITVIVHSELDYDKIYNTGILFFLIEYLDNLLQEFQWIRIAVENVVPVNYECDIILRNNYLYDNVELVGNLREYTVHKKRIGTILDVAHAIGTKRVHDAIAKTLRLDTPTELYDLENYFRVNRNVCFGVHWASMNGFGIKSKDHGTPIEFDESGAPDVKALELFKKYGYDCYICPEIKEKDYTDAVNLKSAIEIIKNYQSSSGQ